MVAIKCMKNTFENVEQVNSLREIQALRRLNSHPNIIELLDLIRGRKQYLSSNLVKLYSYQLLMALNYMHKNNIFHRDIKPENILVMGEQLKLADFGSCRGIYSKQPFTE
ncbi:hypothetical protein AAMO2058_000701700 [Amorphochlora amoebiformis]